jgi:hypothetical protein
MAIPPGRKRAGTGGKKKNRNKGGEDFPDESESRENLRSDDGAFSQEYFVYFKKKGRRQSANCPGGAEVGEILAPPKKKKKRSVFGRSAFLMKRGQNEKDETLCLRVLSYREDVSEVTKILLRECKIKKIYGISTPRRSVRALFLRKLHPPGGLAGAKRGGYNDGRCIE